MKKLFIILPCLIALGGCDKINFHETDIECIIPDKTLAEIKYDSLDINPKRAILQIGDNKLIMNRYTSEETPTAILYKNETNELFPQYLHYVDKDIYSLGTDLTHWGACRKASK